MLQLSRTNDMAKWIQFLQMQMPADRKTKGWIVQSIDGGAHLGEVKWYGAWRRYCFYSAESCIFEQDCLRDIASFCESETAMHNALRKAG